MSKIIRPRSSSRVLSVLSLLLLAVLSGPLPAAAQEPSEIDALRAEIVELRRTYEARIADLESRLATLEAAQTEGVTGVAEEEQVEAQGASEEDALAALRAAARAAVEPTPEAPPAATAKEAAKPGGERNLNRLNPEISVTGDLRAATSSSAREEFSVREFELDLQSALDPFSRMRLTLSTEPDNVEIEEAYLAYSSLAPGLGLTFGRFRQQFGALNRQHLHALPQTEYPLVLRRFFGVEALAQTGVSLRWLVPRPWASANELVVELTDGDNEAFGGESFQHLAGLVHLKNFWDVSPATYFEWGLSGIVGGAEGGETTRVWGSDMTLHWQPPSRAKYRELTWRTEVLLSERDPNLGERVRAWGGYSYLEGLIARGLSIGARLDLAEDPLDPALRTWGVVPYLTWWQSEFVRLRGELQYYDDDVTGESATGFLFQATFAAGPHKHETY